MEKLRFRSTEHEDFYYEMLQKLGKDDSYHRALFYTIGISQDTRKYVNRLFDFEQDGIKPRALNESWQTSGSLKVTRLAFNLWNGYIQKRNEDMTTPYELFACGYASYFFEAIKLRYPDYIRETRKSNKIVEFTR